MASYLSIESLCVSYGETRVLDCVSLGVERGEMIALLGSSGCGKTTLLRSGRMGKSSMSDSERESLIVYAYNLHGVATPSGSGNFASD